MIHVTHISGKIANIQNFKTSKIQKFKSSKSKNPKIAKQDCKKDGVGQVDGPKYGVNPVFVRTFYFFGLGGNTGWALISLFD